MSSDISPLPHQFLSDAHSRPLLLLCIVARLHSHRGQGVADTLRGGCSNYLLEADIRNIFDQYDRDGNGYLGASDLAKVYKILGENLDDDLVRMPPVPALQGAVNGCEIHKLSRPRLHTRGRAMRSRLRAIGACACSGCILSTVTLFLCFWQIDELIREADKDGDGQIGARRQPNLSPSPPHCTHSEEDEEMPSFITPPSFPFFYLSRYLDEGLQMGMPLLLQRTLSFTRSSRSSRRRGGA